MSRAKLINAFNLLAEAAALVAIELEASDAPAAGSSSTPAPSSEAGGPARPSAPANTEIIDQGECPKHHKPWKVGNFGPYCSQPTDDAAWGKQRGDKTWCSITPKNAPKWLEINGLAA